MSKSQPTYTREIKQQAATLFETSGKSKTQIARYLGIYVTISYIFFFSSF